MKYLLTLLYFLTFTVVHSQILVTNELEIRNISNEIKVAEDIVLTPNLERAATLKNWKPVKKHGFVKPYSDFAYWLKFEITSTTSRTVYLYNKYKLLEECKFYLLKNDSLILFSDHGYKTGKTSDLHDYNPSIPLELKKNIVYQCYIFINKTFASSASKLLLQSKEAHDNYKLQSSIIDGISIGVMVTILLIGITRVVIFKQRVFLYYAVYLFGLILAFLALTGIGRFYFWKDIHVFSTFTMYIGAVISLLFLGKIIFLILNVKNEFKLLYFLFKLLTILSFFSLSLGILLYCTLDNPPLFIYQFSVPLLIFYPILFIAVCTKTIRKHKSKIAIGLLAVFSFSFFFIVMLSLMTLTESVFLIFIDFKWLILYEGIAVFIILNLDLYRSKREETKLQKQLVLEKEQSNIRFIEGQNLERLSISQKLHDSSANKIVHLTHYIQQKYEDPLVALKLKDLHFEIRNISHELSPINPKTKSLDEIVSNEIFILEDLYEDIEFICQINVKDTTSKQNSEIINLVFWTCMELISNALKHSNCNKINISISECNKTICLKVSDNGKGYDLNVNSFNLGLTMIVNRAKAVKGNFEIKRINGNSVHTFTLPIV